MKTELSFIHVGYSNVICANRIIAAIDPLSASGRRFIATAKDLNRYIDATHRRPTKTILLLEDSFVVGCAISRKAILSRLQGVALSATLTLSDEDNTDTDADDTTKGENADVEPVD